jgi:hypothetical protein
MEWWLSATAALTTVAASVAWLFVPAYGHGVTVADENGNGIYALLLAPVVIAALPMLAGSRRHRATVISAWLLTASCLVSGFTIGYFYWPSALLLILAAYSGARVDGTAGQQRTSRGSPTSS